MTSQKAGSQARTQARAKLLTQHAATRGSVRNLLTARYKGNPIRDRRVLTPLWTTALCLVRNGSAPALTPSFLRTAAPAFKFGEVGSKGESNRSAVMVVQ
jgi:hypothetical protein